MRGEEDQKSIQLKKVSKIMSKFDVINKKNG